MTKVKFLITGGAGFYAGHIAERALALGNSVVVIDIINSENTPIKEKENNINILEQTAAINNSEFKIYRVDIKDKASMLSIFADENPNIVIHAAALANDRASMNTAVEFINTNVIGSQIVIEAAMTIKSISQFIVISTRSVYGQAPSVSAAVAENTCLRPINPYGATKLAMEGLFHSYHFDTKVPVKICRMQSMYGPRLRHDMMVWRVINSILTGEKVEKYGTSEVTRDWLYISDAVDAVFGLVKAKFSFDVFNVGTGFATSTNNLITLCEETAQKKANIVESAVVRGDNLFAGIADSTKIYETCGWRAKTGIRNGLRKTYNYMKSIQ